MPMPRAATACACPATAAVCIIEASHHVASHGSEVTKRLIAYTLDSIVKLGKTRPDWDGKVSHACGCAQGVGAPISCMRVCPGGRRTHKGW